MTLTGLAPYLIAASAAVILLLGAVHLIYTFRGPRLLPRDRELRTRMEAVSPVITRETTMWKAWIGFNASHSYGAILFGLVWGQFALAQPAMLFGSPYLLGVGALLLGGYVFLGVRYWFSVPSRGIMLAAACYLAGIAAHFA